MWLLAPTPEGNLKLTDHSAKAFDLPATETLPSGGRCNVHQQGIAERKTGGEESDPPVSPFFTAVLCAFSFTRI